MPAITMPKAFWPILTLAALLASVMTTPAAAQPDPEELRAEDDVTQADARSPAEALRTRLIVTYTPGAEERLDTDSALAQADDAAGVVQADAQVIARTVDDAAVIQLDRRLTEEQVQQYAADMEADPTVSSVEVDELRTISQSDPRTAEQWHYNESTGGIGLDDALGVSTGSGATVAVIDTGIVAHPDLDSQVVGGYDFISDTFVSRDGNGRDGDFADEGDWNPVANECFPGSRSGDSSWHGSHVAGTVAAVSGNGEGGQGVAPDADIVVARALGRCGGFDSDIAAAIVWSAGGSVTGLPANPNPADVINMSLGGGAPSCPSSYQSAIDQARSLGAIVVVAAGNESQDAQNATPANCDGVITVASTNRSGARSSFSNFGSIVELAGPGGGAGGGVLSTVDRGATTPARGRATPSTTGPRWPRRRRRGQWQR